jgi:hypothetical protein
VDECGKIRTGVTLVFTLGRPESIVGSPYSEDFGTQRLIA